MKKNLFVLLVTLLFGSAGCGGADIANSDDTNLLHDSSLENTSPPASLTTINFRASQSSLPIGGTLQLLVDLSFSDQTIIPSVKNKFLPPSATRLDEAENLTWTAEPATIATVDENGFVRALMPGQVTLTTTSGTKNSSLRLTVFNPYADRVVSYTRGENGGFNEEYLPQIVLGPPKGFGLLHGSTDVVSLGHRGEIVLEFTNCIIINEEGPDFTVFENAFYQDGDPDLVYAEPAFVAVSEDGIHFVEFPCDISTRSYRGCAGIHPVYANPDENTIPPIDPSVSGGDSFDLAQVGLQSARFVRIRDANIRPSPIGPMKGGFDLDAIAAIHGTISP